MILSSQIRETGLIIFCRNNSKRLPKKGFIKIGNRCLLGRIIDLAKLVGDNLRIVVATSDQNYDDSIEEFCNYEKISIFRGNESNVLKRAIDCCETFGFKRFARICADRPFFLPSLIESLLSDHIKLNLDLATNCLKKTYPSGLTTEIILVKSLKKIQKLSGDKYDLEHLTNFFYKKKELFKIKNYECQIQNIGHYNLAIDSMEDVIRTEWINEKLKKKISPSLNKLVYFMKQYKIKNI